MNVHARFNREDVEKLSRGFALAVQAESVRTLEHLADQAIRQLAAFDNALGHHYLAELWTHTPPIVTEDATYMEVYSLAEDMMFYDKTSSADLGRHRSSKYPISGEALLTILEGGAQEHEITPRDPNGVLTIPGTNVEANTREHIRENGPGSFLESEPGDTEFTRHVDHPGVQANHNIAVTRTMLELGLEEVAEEAARNIALRLV